MNPRLRLITAILASLLAGVLASMKGESVILGALVGLAVLVAPYIGLAKGRSRAIAAHADPAAQQRAVRSGWIIGLLVGGAVFAVWLGLLTENRTMAIVFGVVVLIIEVFLYKHWIMATKVP